MSTIEHQAAEWVARQFARGLTDSERAALQAWLAADRRHYGAYARALAIHNAISVATAPLVLPATAPMRAPWHDAVPFPRRSFLRYGGLAACLAATAGAGGFYALQRQAVLTTAKGEFRKVPLADTSIAEINSGSRIEVRFTDQQRQINLRQGEAWFEVAKDKTKPFIVESGKARIRAVGTAFAVRRFANGTEVLVTEGTVQVWTQDATARRQLLTVGERAFLADGITVTRQPNEVRRKLAWREGKLILKNQTLSEAVLDFNRYSSKTIVIRDAALGGRRLFGQYQLDAPELFAQDVSTVLDVPLHITSDTIYIGHAPRET
jgi:transmembrane sensor